MNKIVILTLSLLLSMPVVSQADSHGEGEGKEMGEKIMKKLDLNADQKKQMKELRKGHKPKMKALREKKKALREKMQEAMKSDSSESQLRSIFKEKQTVKNQLADLRFEKRMAMRKILTKEQRMKFHEMKKERKGKRKGWRKKHKKDY